MARAWADVDLDAVRHNVALLVELAGPAAVCAVVKADGYGHGAVAVARAAVEAGATWLAVATVDEAAALRDAGVDGPVLLLSEPAADEVDAVAGLGLRATVYTPGTIAALSAAALGRPGGEPVRAHLKVDTGMHRVGAAPSEVPEVAAAVVDAAGLELEAVWTHCAVADEPANPFTVEQLARFDKVLSALRDAGISPPMVHAANSAGTIAHPAARRDLVRCGIAVYGLAPAPALAGCLPLRPALALRSEVSFVKTVPAGDGISYGLRYRAARDSVVATVPVGYADGVPRRLAETGGEVLVRGRRRRIAGAVTMDQLMVDCGAAGDPAADEVRPGDAVTLIGSQGGEVIAADEWADRTGTIAYEIVCGIGPRVPRRHAAATSPTVT